MSDQPDQPDPAPESMPESARREDAVSVVRRLRDAGHIAYFAGGCVRDMLLGLEPKDYDVATDAPPDRVRQLFANTQTVGAAFGVILVRHRKSTIEVATFRSDGKYTDGRRPEEVTFTTAEEDAKRRDFTINGMFYDPIDQKVIDYVGGQRDLKYKWIRAIGNPDQRFKEDHLRLLRAIRFGARLGFEIKGETAIAISMHSEQLKRISPERIAEELRLMLTPPTREAAWLELWRFGMMPVLFRYLPEQWSKSLWDKDNGPVFPLVAYGESIPFGLALAATALCYRTAQAVAEPTKLLERGEVHRTVQACRKALKISNDEADMVTACLELAPLLQEQLSTVATMKRFLAGRYASEARQLLNAIGQARTIYKARVELLNQHFNEFLRGDVAPPPFVTGDDLTAAGFRPGPLFKRVLDAVYDAQLENRVRNHEEARMLAKNLAAGQSASSA